MSDSFKLGEHESKIEQLAADMELVKQAVMRIEIALAEKRGERRVALWAAGGMGTAASTLVTLIWKYVTKH